MADLNKDAEAKRKADEAAKREREAAERENAEREEREAAEREEQEQREREAREEVERQQAAQNVTSADAKAALEGTEDPAAKREREANMKADRKSRQKSAKEAANMIRQDISQPPAEARHLSGFAENVCRELGMDVTPMNVARVIHSLQKRGIEPQQAEYPKWVGGDERTGVGGTIVHSEDEERQYFELRDRDPEAAQRYEADQNALTMGGGVGSVGDPINPLRDRPAYEPGALPGEPGGQDGPEASPVRVGTEKGGKAPAQTIEHVANDPSKRLDIDTAQGLNAASRTRTDSPDKPANQGNPDQPFPKVQQQQREQRLQDRANG